METVPDFVGTIKRILSEPPENWALSRSFFHQFYNENILNDKDGWNVSVVERILGALKSAGKTKEASFTESLVIQFDKTSNENKIIEKLISVVKICDKHAYKQDHKMPVVATTLLRQDVFYKNILNWKLEERKSSLRDDVLNSKALVPIIKNIFLFLFEPSEFITMVGLRHRQTFINRFIDPDYTLYNYEPVEKICIESNKIILEYFKELIKKEKDSELLLLVSNRDLEKHFFSNVVSHAVYDDKIKIIWDNKEANTKVKYWQIAPGEQARLWDDLLDKSIAAVGFSKIDVDLKGITEGELMRLMQERLPDHGEHKLKVSFRQLWNFINLKPGDKFVSNKGQSFFLGLGNVKATYKFRPDRDEYKHTIDVEYYKVSREGIQIPDRLKGKFGKTIIPLKHKDFEEIESLFENGASSSWIFQANPKIYDIESALKVLKQINWSVRQHKDKIKKGDTVYIWQSGSNASVLAVGSVITDPGELQNDKSEEPFVIMQEAFQNEELSVKVEITSVLRNPIKKEALFNHPILSGLTLFKGPQGTNFALTGKQAEAMNELIKKELPIEIYTKENALKDLFISEKDFDYVMSRLKSKKNIILQGPPGVGKTFIAKRLAYYLMGFKDDTRISMVQFHQSYSYEDFVQGFRPNEDGKFTLRNGLFYEFCRQAVKDPDNKYIFIIDEINRGNLSKIFGEMLMLIEADKRGQQFAVPLTYGRGNSDSFHIPENLHLIGTMNTADRSLAMVDYALRRRFSFIDLKPQFQNPKFRQLLFGAGIQENLLTLIIDRIQALNKTITDDSKNLGPGYCIGHSYFCPSQTDQSYDESWYRMVITSEIAPLLREYWFDDPKRVADNEGKLLAGIPE